MTTERLQKILARAGYGSRRVCETLLEEGRVSVDGHVARLGDKADPYIQRITVDGTGIKLLQDFTYILLNKPRGYITTTSDPHGRRTVLDLIDLPRGRQEPTRLFPVGRLDAESEGLVLLTNDGELTQLLTHPRYGHSRVYEVQVEGFPDEQVIDRWQRGIMLEDRQSRFDAVQVISRDQETTWLRATVYEGRNHLVRRMVAALGYPARRLIRVRMGSLGLGSLASGHWRYLTPGELAVLRKEVGLDAPGTRKDLSKHLLQHDRPERGSRSSRFPASQRRARQ